MHGFCIFIQITLHMVQYISQRQLKIEKFGMVNQIGLNPENRWIILGNTLPWDQLVKIYIKSFSNKGRASVNPRIVIGSLIIKHKLSLSDEQTVQIIEENPYMQYFLGLDEFAPVPLFSPSLFVEWRKQLGNEDFNKFSDVLIKICCEDKIATPTSKQVNLPNKGKLKLDATVADQYITYPNDLGLLNKAREISERLIDGLYELVRQNYEVKPRTYRKVARKKYLAESKKRQANPKTLRSAIRYHLNCLDRNIASINQMLDLLETIPFSRKQLKNFYVIQTLNSQQRQMYNENSNRCDDRIVSISQPHVRPIVRGKAGKKVEFGSKLGVAHIDGFVKAQTLSWNPYNESADLIPHAKAYKELLGYYPELIQVDAIYGTNKNRKWAKQNGIRLTVKAKGKPAKQSRYQKRKTKKEFNERNQIEGKFGQAKQGYGLNQVKAKLNNTSASWIGISLFIVNLVKFAESNGFHF